MAPLKRPAAPASTVPSKRPTNAVDAACGDWPSRRVASAVPAAAAAKAESEKVGEDQAVFDEKVSELFSELGELTEERPKTAEEGQGKLRAVSGLIGRATKAMKKARGIDDSVMKVVLGEATKEKELLLSEIYFLKREEGNKKVEESIERTAERGRRESEKRKKKKEALARLAEASMLDKECKICFEEIDDGVECSLCNNILGCKVCVDDWMARGQKECLFCRIEYTDVTQQVRRVVEKMTPDAEADAPPAMRPMRRVITPSSP